MTFLRPARCVGQGERVQGYGTVTGGYHHNSVPGQPVTLMFDTGTTKTFDRDERLMIEEGK